MAITYTLTPTQAALYVQGRVAQWQVEEACLAWAARRDPTQPVIVYDLSGQVVFALTPGRST